jgi:hypothetical protein
MPKPECEFHSPAAAWQPGDPRVPGIWIQVLAADPESGDLTALQRYDPGVDTTPIGARVHDYWEEVYILSGDLTDLRLGQTFTAGMYACRPPGMRHGPWRTDGGVLMLEMRSAVRTAVSPR